MVSRLFGGVVMKEAMKRISMGVLLLLMTMMCQTAWSINYVPVTAEKSKITGVDVGAYVSKVTLTVTLGEGEAPNGQAQLRLSGNETNLVNNGANLLQDDVLAEGSSPNEWTITWSNVPAGTYDVYFKQSSGGTHTKLGSITIKEIPNINLNVLLEEKAAYCDPNNPQATNDSKNGTVMVNVLGGSAPFKYSATIYRNDGSTETKEHSSSNRAWKIDGLGAGESVKVTVSDDANKSVTKKSNLITFEDIEVWAYYQTMIVWRGNCKFDTYVHLRILAESDEVREAQKQLLAKTVVVVPRYGPNAGKEFKAVYEPALDGKVSYNSDYLHVYFRIPEGALPLEESSNSYFDFKYKVLCKSEVQTRNSKYTSLKNAMRVYPAPGGSIGDDCQYKDLRYGMRFYFNGEWSNWYLNKGDVFAKIYKKNLDGSYPATPTYDNVDLSIKQFEVEEDKFSKYFNVSSGGTYKIVFGDPSCPFSYCESEVTISDPKPLIKTKNYKYLGIHGNTGGVQFAVYNTSKMPYTVTIERPDGKTSFEVTDFLSDRIYTTNITFPRQFVADETFFDQTDDGYPLLKYMHIGDLPEGNYILKIRDNCGYEGQTSFEIKSNDLIHYKPKQTDGYKDGVYIGLNCAKDPVVKFDFGVLKGHAASDTEFDGKLNDWQAFTGIWTSENSDNVKGFWKAPKVGSLCFIYADYFSYYFDDLRTLVPQITLYDAIHDEIRTFGTSLDFSGSRVPADTEGADQKPDTYYRKTFQFDFNKLKEQDVFLLRGTICDRLDTKAGIIGVSLKKGVNVSYPLKYTLYKAKNGRRDGGAVKTYTANSSADGTDVVWTGLEQGCYFVNIVYGPEECGQDHPVEIKLADIPKPSVEKPDRTFEVTDRIEVDITDGMKPKHVYLPVSPHIYNVEWYDVTDGKNDKKGDGNELYASFTEPGVYTYQIRTTLTNKTDCEGSSGGERFVTFYVTKKAPKPNYWMGGTSECFDDASNWTANKVPEEKETIEFATVENYGTAAQRDCRLKGTSGTPLSFVAGSLINQSQKVMVVPAGASLRVTGGMRGFQHEANDPVRLRIEAGVDAKPNGAFTCTYTGADKDAVYAEVQMNALSKSVKEKWTDDKIVGSPTAGKSFFVDYTDQFFGIPFQTMSASQFSESLIYRYDETHNAEKSYYKKFVGLKKGAEMTAFSGYDIRRKEPTTFSLTGFLNLGDAQLMLSRRASAVVGATGAYVHWGLGQNIFGNSYTAPIKVSVLEFPETVAQTVYLYRTGSVKDWGDNVASGNGKGSYLALPKNTAVAQGVAEIPSMQGFLVKFKDEHMTYGGDDAKMTIQYASQVAPKATLVQMAKPFEMTEKAAPGYVHFCLQGDKFADEMWLFEQPGTSAAFDDGWDGDKLGFETMDNLIYSAEGEKAYQVNTTDCLLNANVTVRTANEGYCTLHLTRHNLPQYPDLKLVDLVAKQVIPFEGNQLEYGFNAKPQATANSRFMMVNTKSNDFGTIVTKLDNVLTEHLQGSAVLYDLTGVEIVRLASVADLKSVRHNLKNGVYILKVSRGSDHLVRKIVIDN